MRGIIAEPLGGSRCYIDSIQNQSSEHARVRLLATVYTIAYDSTPATRPRETLHTIDQQHNTTIVIYTIFIFLFEKMIFFFLLLHYQPSWTVKEVYEWND